MPLTTFWENIMLIISNVNLSLDTDFESLKSVMEKELKTHLKSAELYKISVDARKKDNVHFCCSVLVSADNEPMILKRNKNAALFTEVKYNYPVFKGENFTRPVIVGFGPAGMFCALVLSRAGLKPIVLERGQDADQRKADVEAFLNGGELKQNSNVQFGEGGAGTFSDGKLNTGIKDIRCREVLKTFADFGGGDKILYDAKPHIGTDVLISVVKNIRREIIKNGGEVRFNTRLEKINTKSGKIVSVIAGGKEITCDKAILATGHSARDVFSLLKQMNVNMSQKPFSMGVRIEHRQEDINKVLYGKFYNHPALSAADYKLAVHLENGRGVYTFCMCPGGEVINSSSEEGGLAVNGMSNSARDGQNANSALLVSVEPQDLKSDDIMAGCYLQQKIEKKAYEIAQGSVPITTVGQLLKGEKSKIGRVKPTVKPSCVFADFESIFPKFITDSLKEALPLFDRKIKGFASSDAILTAPETRSSSPIRILRNDKYQSESIKGLYPCGEGAGYAGGIMSAAVDGMRVAEQVIDDLNNKE